MKSFFSQMFRGPNGNWDIGRIMGAKSLSAYSAAFLWSIFKLHQVPDWASLGTGYAMVMAGAGALIGLKDIAVAKATTPPTA
jgi:hypothetical protein